MKSIILCGGYAVRLQPLTLNKSKVLLGVKGRTILDYIIDRVEPLKEIDDIFVVSNNKFYNDFAKWKDSRTFEKNIKILNDGTSSDNERLGGIGDLEFAIKNKRIKDDVLVVLGDNLFDFELDGFVNFFEKKKSCVLGLYDVKSFEEAKRFGVINLKRDIISKFEEKPEKPKSSLVSTGLYIFSKDELTDLKDYIHSGGKIDGPGFFVKYLMRKKNVFGCNLSGRWFDIGTAETYKEVCEKWWAV